VCGKDEAFAPRGPQAFAPVNPRDLAKETRRNRTREQLNLHASCTSPAWIPGSLPGWAPVREAAEQSRLPASRPRRGWTMATAAIAVLVSISFSTSLASRRMRPSEADMGGVDHPELADRRRHRLPRQVRPDPPAVPAVRRRRHEELVPRAQEAVSRCSRSRSAVSAAAGAETLRHERRPSPAPPRATGLI